MNPFPGLRPFREDEAHLFFGREQQVGTMLAKLARSHFLSVVGTSGCGKSSLVNCGLLPALHRGDLPGAGRTWSRAQFRPGNDPIGAMARALAAPGVLPALGRKEPFPLAELIESTLRMSRLGLIDVWQQARFPADTSLLIIVDQFEELFRYQSVGATGGGPAFEIAEDAMAFVNLLLEVRAHTHLPIYVTLTMRSDFLGETAQFAGLPEAIDSGHYLVPRMSRDERRRAVEGPIHSAGATISPVLLTRLVNDVGDNPDQLSILQHALHRTWAQWEKDGASGELQPAHYQEIGTMARALNEHAEEAYGELTSARQQDICAKMFKALTDKSTNLNGVRRPTDAATLLTLTGATMAELESVMAVFRKRSRSFLMPPDDEPLTPKTVVDISHESLMRVWDRLRLWSDAEAQDAMSYRRLVWTAELHSQEKANLWRGRDLEGARLLRRTATKVWAERYAPGFEKAMSFVDESERRQNWIRSAATGVLVLAAAGGVAFTAERIREDRRALEADRWALEQKVKTQTSGSSAILGLARSAVKPTTPDLQVSHADLAARVDAFAAITVVSQEASAPIAERSRITVEYRHGRGDTSELAEALKKLGFTVEETSTSSRRAANCIWYDPAVPEESVKLVAYTVIGAGHELVGVQRLGSLSGKSQIKIGHNYHLQAEKPLAAVTISETPLPRLHRTLAKAEEDVVGSVVEVTDNRGVVKLDDGRGPISFDREPGGSRLAVGDKVTLTVFFPPDKPPYAEWVTPVRTQSPSLPNASGDPNVARIQTWLSAHPANRQKLRDWLSTRGTDPENIPLVLVAEEHSALRAVIVNELLK